MSIALYRMSNGKFAMRDDGKLMIAPSMYEFEECCCSYLWKLIPCYYADNERCPGEAEDTLWTDQSLSLWATKVIYWRGACYQVDGPYKLETIDPPPELIEETVVPQNVFDTCEYCCTCPCPFDADLNDPAWQYLLLDVPAMTDYAVCPADRQVNPQNWAYAYEWRWPAQTIMLGRNSLCQWLNTAALVPDGPRGIVERRMRQWEYPDCSGKSGSWSSWIEEAPYINLRWHTKDYHGDKRFECIWEVFFQSYIAACTIFGNKDGDSPTGLYLPTQGRLYPHLGWNLPQAYVFPELPPGMAVYQLP